MIWLAPSLLSWFECQKNKRARRVFIFFMEELGVPSMRSDRALSITILRYSKQAPRTAHVEQFLWTSVFDILYRTLLQLQPLSIFILLVSFKFNLLIVFKMISFVEFTDTFLIILLILVQKICVWRRTRRKLER